MHKLVAAPLINYFITIINLIYGLAGNWRGINGYVTSIRSKTLFQLNIIMIGGWVV